MRLIQNHDNKAISIIGRTVRIQDTESGSLAVRRIPEHIPCFSVSIVNGQVFIDGYQLFIDKGWRRTLRAFWHQWF